METLKLRKEMPQMLFGSFQMNDKKKVYGIVERAAQMGVFGFDTSPSYRTEASVSEAINRYIREHGAHREQFYLQSKVDVWQMLEGKGDVRPYVRGKLKQIHQSYFDLLLIHWPHPDYFAETWKFLEKAYEEGYVKAIGICNAKKRHFDRLEAAGANICPMVVQNEIHPLNTDSEVVAYAQSLGAVVQAYSPLCRMLPGIKDNQMLNQMAKESGVSVAQIVLAWHMAKGLVPIVKTSKVERVGENVDAMNLRLTQDEIDRITAMNENFKVFLESRCCPGY